MTTTTMIPQQPLVSIITPAYNVEKYIAEAIESVINQTWQNWELLITNDGSTDTTEQICQHYVQQDSRIKLTSTENRGVSAARNLGLAQAKGEYIAFLDADDVYPPNSIKARVEANIKYDADVVGGKILLLDEHFQNKLLEFSSNIESDFLPPLCKMQRGVFLAVFYTVKADSIRNVLFDVEMRNSEDLLFWLNACSRKQLKFKGIQEESYHYRHLKNSASNNMIAWATGQKEVLKKLWGLKIGLRNKIILSAILLRQLSSYHIKISLGIKTKQFKEVC